MRTLSTRARQALYAQQTDEVFLVLLTLSHPQLATPIYVVNNPVSIVSRGITYLAAAFTVGLPDETDSHPPRAQLSVDNVDRIMVWALRAIDVRQGLPKATLEIILAAQPDTVEAGPFVFSLGSADYTDQLITGELLFEDFLDETFPAATFVPSIVPGLF